MLRSTGLISFAGGSPAWRRVQARFLRDSRKSGVFGPIEVYDDKRLAMEFPQFFSSRQHLFATPSRGYGFWSWKPFLIREFLEKMHPNCKRVVFLDAGSHFNVNSKSLVRFKQYEEMVDENGYLFMQMNHLPEQCWTSLEVLDYFELNQEQRQSGQIVGGFNIWSHQEESLSLLSEWDTAMAINDGEYLRDPVNRQGLHFLAHRHDQSLLSCIVKRAGACTIPDETDFYPDFALGSDFPIWTTRNTTRFSFKKNSIVRELFWRTDYYALSPWSRFTQSRYS